MDKYEALKLNNQLCFPLYACANEVVKLYQPVLSPLDLTYTQYVVMLALWEKDDVNVKTLGEMLHLDSGTLTPLLKKLVAKGYVRKERSSQDERNVVLSVTEEGYTLRDRALEVPCKVGSCVPLSPEESAELYRLTHKLLDAMR